MIIQCKTCGTKYRFDKSQIEGEGIWVRCTRCETTFFQKNPLVEIASLMSLMGWEGDIPEGAREEGGDRVFGEVEETGDEREPAWKEDSAGVVEITDDRGMEEGAAEEGDRAFGEGEVTGGEREPVWEEDSAGVVEITADRGMEEGAAEEGDRIFGEAELTGDEREPSWEGGYGDTGEIADRGGVEDGAAEERNRVFAGIDGESDEQEPRREEAYGDVGEIMYNEGIRGRQRVRESWPLGDADEIIYNAGIPGRERIRRTWPLGRKLVVYLLLLLLIVGGVYLWLSPQARGVISNRVLPTVEKLLGKGMAGIGGITDSVVPRAKDFLGIKNKGAPDTGGYGLGANLIDVKERFVKNWIAGDIMAVEGIAVNSNKVTVSNIRVKGTIRDASGSVLFEEESNCGNILTDDELKSLTKQEIEKELSNPHGRELPNISIKPGEGIPFMLVFMMPNEEASEFVVELAGIEAAKRE